MAEELQVAELPPAEQPSEDPSAMLIAMGRETGHVTGEQIAAAVEEVELGPEGIRDLHTRLVDAGVEIVVEAIGEVRGRSRQAPRSSPPT